MGQSRRVGFASWSIFVILAIIWGSSFLLIKYGLIYFSAGQVGSMRIFIAFLFLLPLALVRIRRFKRADLKWISVSGLLGYLFPALLFAYAELVIPSSAAGVLNSLTPIFTLLVAYLWFGNRFSTINTIGVFTSMAGAAGLMLTNNNGIIDVRIGYAMLIVLATICYAINLNIVKNKLSHLHPVDITSFAFLLAGPVAAIHLFLFTPVITSLRMPGAGWGLMYVGTLAIVGSALALMLFNILIQTTPVIVSSSVTYLIPVVASIVGLADGEPFNPGYFLWIAVILVGIVMVNIKRKIVKQKGISSALSP